MRLVLILCLSIGGGAAVLAGSPELKHREQSFTLHLDGSVAQVTPLFGPVREREWSPEWMPQFIYPQPAAQVEGALFTTEKDHQRRIWILTRFDIASGHVEYVVTPGSTANQIKIAVVPDGNDRSKATVTYRHTALEADGNEQVEQLDAAWAEEQRNHWEAAINQALRKHQAK